MVPYCATRLLILWALNKVTGLVGMFSKNILPCLSGYCMKALDRALGLDLNV